MHYCTFPFSTASMFLFPAVQTYAGLCAWLWNSPDFDLIFMFRMWDLRWSQICIMPHILIILTKDLIAAKFDFDRIRGVYSSVGMVG